MRTKRVNRYYCDYCGKGGCQAAAMRKHERHCTMNPNRVCRMCRVLNQPQPDIENLVALLPRPQDYEHHDYGSTAYKGFGAAMKDGMAALREAADGCPACILAAIRQAGWSGMVGDFDYQKEARAVFAMVQEREERAEMDAIMYG